MLRLDEELAARCDTLGLGGKSENEREMFEFNEGK